MQKIRGRFFRFILSTITVVGRCETRNLQLIHKVTYACLSRTLDGLGMKLRINSYFFEPKYFSSP